MKRLVRWYGAGTLVGIFATLVMVGLAVLLLPGALSWWGSYATALDWGNGSAFLIGPAAAGIAATRYAQMVVPGWSLVVGGSPRRLPAWLEPALVVWFLSFAAVLALSVAALTVTLVTGGVGGHPRGFLAWGATAAVLLASVALGAAIGARLGRAWSGPVAAVCVYALGALGALGIVPNIFDVGPGGQFLVGLKISASFVAQQIVACLAVAGVVLLVLQHRLYNLRTWLSVAASCVVVIGAVVISVGLGGQRYVVDSAPPKLSCAGANPVVCLAEETSRPLDALAREMDRQAQALRRLGVELPRRWVQAVEGARLGTPEVGVMRIPIDQVAARTVDPEVVSFALASPSECRQFSSNILSRSEQRGLLAPYILGDWIASVNGVADRGRLGMNREDAWLADRSKEQRDWVRKTYPRLRNCDLGAIRPPF